MLGARLVRIIFRKYVLGLHSWSEDVSTSSCASASQKGEPAGLASSAKEFLKVFSDMLQVESDEIPEWFYKPRGTCTHCVCSLIILWIFWRPWRLSKWCARVFTYCIVAKSLRAHRCNCSLSLSCKLTQAHTPAIWCRVWDFPRNRDLTSSSRYRPIWTQLKQALTLPAKHALDMDHC